MTAAFPDPLWILLAALLLDAALGDPPWLWNRLPHPVVLVGRAIAWCERRWNDPRRGEAARRVAGVLVLLGLLAAALLLGRLLEAALRGVPHGWLGEAALAATLLAQRSLYEHVAAVRRGFRDGGLAGGRAAVSRIVGRDPDSLDEPAVCRAAVESLAENFSDGVVAPVFWYALLGLPGLLAYKLVNTADSMIGHRSERYAAFGWASARFDDLVNLPASRLTALLLLLAAPGRAAEILAALRRDAPRHRSPNAGWPEAAMAAVLGIAIAGPRRYGGREVADAWMNEAGRQAVTPRDIGRALRLYLKALAILWAALLLAALIFG